MSDTEQLDEYELDHSEPEYEEPSQEELEYLKRRMTELRNSDTPKIKPRPKKGTKHCADPWCLKELSIKSEYEYCFTHAKMYERIEYIKSEKVYDDKFNPFIKSNNIMFEKRPDEYIKMVYDMTGIYCSSKDDRKTKITRLNMYKKRY